MAARPHPQTAQPSDGQPTPPLRWSEAENAYLDRLRGIYYSDSKFPVAEMGCGVDSEYIVSECSVAFSCLAGACKRPRTEEMAYMNEKEDRLLVSLGRIDP